MKQMPEPVVNLSTEQFVGWLFKANYRASFVLTNDAWLANNPTPRNALLLATDPAASAGYALLLRVNDFGEVPLSDELLQTQLQQVQRRQSPGDLGQECDPLTKAQLQYGQLPCDVMGTFYLRDGVWNFGADRPDCAAQTLPVNEPSFLFRPGRERVPSGASELL